jgi:hypothetical protein
MTRLDLLDAGLNLGQGESGWDNSWNNPWKLIVIAMALVIVTAVVTGVVDNWRGIGVRGQRMLGAFREGDRAPAPAAMCITSARTASPPP